MADPIGLMDVLKDPNYINANEATKKAIFDKYSASDKNYTDANDATKSAIRQKFGVDKVEEKEPSILEKVGKFISEETLLKNIPNRKDITEPIISAVAL